MKDSSHISVAQQLTPTTVKPLLSYNIVKICPGLTHTAVIDSKFANIHLRIINFLDH